MRVQGIVTALVTPLTQTGDPDIAGLERLIDQQMGAGIDALFILGSVGEGVLLADADYRRVTEESVRLVGGRRPVLAGASDNSLARCRAKLAYLHQAGVDAAVCTLPFYGWPGGGEHAIRFFRELGKGAPLPLIPYNLPKAVGWQMPPETLLELSNLPEVIALKDTHGDFDKMAAVAASPSRQGRATYLPGNSALAIRLFAQGADGVVSTPANVLPDVFATAWRMHRAGRAEELARLDREVMPLVNRSLELMPTGAAALKGLLAADGICGAATVAPWPQMDETAIASGREVLQAARAAFAAFLGTVSS